MLNNPVRYTDPSGHQPGAGALPIPSFPGQSFVALLVAVAEAFIPLPAEPVVWTWAAGTVLSDPLWQVYGPQVPNLWEFVENQGEGLKRAAEQAGNTGSPGGLDPNDPWQRLTDVLQGKAKEWTSPRGLHYGLDPDPNIGTPVNHVLRHTADDLSRRTHGVFSVSSREEPFRLIDEAYTMASSGAANARLVQPLHAGRQIWDVNMGRVMGYVGGQLGQQVGNSLTQYVRLIVDNGNELVSAFPVIPG